ncbi:hypothetical protein N431DRAFT_179555 [Stipitochalara longipes BDJ]|nr:hypothetical protein N431DRAFT_179555 [Stipitochalara longipes BDJ]
MKFPRLLFRASGEIDGVNLRCFDCPYFSLRVPDGESTFATTSKLQGHLSTSGHGARLERRYQLLQNISLELNRRHFASGVFIGVHVTKPPRTLLSQITCRICPRWRYIITFAENITNALFVVDAHVASLDHSGGTELGIIKNGIITVVGSLSREMLTQLLALPEPMRSSRWLRSLLEEHPEGQISQHTLWQAYHDCFASFAQRTRTLLVDNATFLKVIMATFQGKAFIEGGAGLEVGPAVIIKGIRPIDRPGPKEWMAVDEDTLVSRVLGRFPKSNFFYEAGEGGPFLRCHDSCKCSFPLPGKTGSGSWSTIVKLAVHVASKEIICSRNLQVDEVRFGHTIGLIAKSIRSKKSPTPETCLGEILLKLREVYPAHHFQIHNVPTLRVVCGECQSYVYDSFDGDGIARTYAKLNLHLLVVHRYGRKKGLREEKAA